MYEVTVEDSGIYICSAIEDSSLSYQAQIVIQPEYVAPPMARIEPKRLDIAQGMNFFIYGLEKSGPFDCLLVTCTLL